VTIQAIVPQEIKAQLESSIHLTIVMHQDMPVRFIATGVKRAADCYELCNTQR
jgi:hypothetical protein